MEVALSLLVLIMGWCVSWGLWLHFRLVRDRERRIEYKEQHEWLIQDQRVEYERQKEQEQIAFNRSPAGIRLMLAERRRQTATLCVQQEQYRALAAQPQFQPQLQSQIQAQMLYAGVQRSPAAFGSGVYFR